MTLCVKNYGDPSPSAKQLSSRLHAEDQENATFMVQGPLGRGLRVKQGGIHIAFAAGTGILCFVDLVAALIREALGYEKNSFKSNLDVNKSS